MIAAAAFALEYQNSGELGKLVGRSRARDPAADDEYVGRTGIVGAQDVLTCDRGGSANSGINLDRRSQAKAIIASQTDAL